MKLNQVIILLMLAATCFAQDIKAGDLNIPSKVEIKPVNGKYQFLCQ